MTVGSDVSRCRRSLTSDVTFLLPDLPIGAGGLEHGFGCLVQPLPFLLGQMAEDRFASRRGTEMDVGGFPSHRVQETEFDVGSPQGGEFYAGTMRAETADDPTPAQLDKGIRAADSTIDDGLVEDFGRSAFLRGVKSLSPVGGRRDQCFCFARDPAAVPVRDGDIAGVSETAEPGCTVRETERDAGSGHKVLEGIDGAYGGYGFEGRECVYSLPEADWIAEFAFGNATEPLVLFAEHVSAAFFLHGFAIAFEDGAADVLGSEGEMCGFDG